jgi:hypothetical protein
MKDDVGNDYTLGWNRCCLVLVDFGKIWRNTPGVAIDFGSFVRANSISEIIGVD